MATSDWVIWNGELGVVVDVCLGEITQNGCGKRTAFLEEPYDMVGPFDLDELETNEMLAFAACLVLSKSRWQREESYLRKEGAVQRRDAARRMAEIFERLNASNERKRARVPNPPKDDPRRDSRKHRQVLELPIEGALAASEIKDAFRRIAKRAHPDVGGSHEGFVRLTAARDALLETAP